MDVDSSSQQCVDGNWINKGDLDLIEKTVEDFRHQRLSMVQSLRQFVLCYESVMEWLVEQDGKST
jgi:protein tyrosine phosphatase